MKNKLKKILKELNQFAKENQIVAELQLHAEQSKLMRFANSTVSLNTHDESLSLSIEAYVDNARGAYSIITNLEEVEIMQAAILKANEIAQHATPSDYALTLTAFEAKEDFDKFFDQRLLDFSSADALDFVNKAVAGLEKKEISLSGAFSSGALWNAITNTLSEIVLVHATTDAHVELVLSHDTDKWELYSDQSAASIEDLDAQKIHTELALLLANFLTKPHLEIAPGKYDIVFGRDAIANFIETCNWIGFDGGSSKRNITFIKETDRDKKIFSDKITITDDPRLGCTFPHSFDYNGLERKPFSIIENGIFKSYMWNRDSADEFQALETAHTVPSISAVLATGSKKINTLAEVLAMPRDKDILYFPYLHYKNVVNSNKSILTGCSRFGALLLKRDGTIEVPFNVRLTDSILNMFNNIDWISSESVATNTSGTYGMRNPVALSLPNFIKINDVNIPRTNHSF